MHKGYLKTAAFLGALSVILGAFAAHKLKTMVADTVVADTVVATFETGVRYMFYHVFALLAVGVLYQYFSNKLLKAAGTLFILGIVLFSGSLFLLTYKEALVLPGLKWAGPITPLAWCMFLLEDGFVWG